MDMVDVGIKTHFSLMPVTATGSTGHIGLDCPLWLNPIPHTLNRPPEAMVK